MSRRFLTAEDVRRAGGAEIVVDPETVVTPQALEVAAQSGVTIRSGQGPYVEPQPDRGPDALRAAAPRPEGSLALDEPGAVNAGDSVIVTCVGRNRAGVLAEVTGALATENVNIHDVSQKMVDDYFHMVLVVEMPAGLDFGGLKKKLECLGSGDYVVRVMHERVFRYMHRI